MAENQPESEAEEGSSALVTTHCPLLPARGAEGWTEADHRRKEEEEYASLAELLQETPSQRQMSKVDIVEQAVSHIQQLGQRVWNTLSTQEDAEKAKAFLLQRISEKFLIFPSGSLVNMNHEPRCHTSSNTDCNLTSPTGSDPDLKDL